MKKLVILIIIVLGLGLCAYYAYLRRNSTLSRNDTRFALESTEGITGIELSDDLAMLTLQKKASGWFLSAEKADDRKVRSLLLAATLIEMESPVAHSSEAKVTEQMDHGVTVSFYKDKKSVLAWTFCEWGKQYYARKKQAGKIYRIGVKGFDRIKLPVIFSTKQEYWATNPLIHLDPDDIMAVSVEYPLRKDKSFHIRQEANNRLIVTDHSDKDITAWCDQETLQDYLHFFSNISYEKMPDDNIRSREKEVLFRLEIVTRAGLLTELTAYPVTDPETGISDPLIFRGHTEKQGTILLKYSDFDPITVPLDYFLKK